MRMDTCAFVANSVVRPRAAGATWTSLTPNASWAIRDGHSAVIVGPAIYVIGGKNQAVVFNDVWVSSDGGADQTQEGTRR